MNIKKITGIMLVLLLGLVGCDNAEKTEEGNNEEFCMYIDTENIDKTIPFIDEYLISLPDNLNDTQKLQRLTGWLASYSCIVDASIFCESCIKTNPAISEILISFDEDGITKDLILDIIMEDPLRVVRSHER